MGKLEVGQKVMVRRSPNDSRGRAPEDQYVPAVVTKVGRVWVDLRRSDLPENALGFGTWRMRIDTQNQASKYSGSNASFATLDQHAWDQTRAWAFGVLKEHGLRVDHGTKWYGREIELAETLVAHAEITALKASRLLTAEVVYPRYLGVDDSGSCTWELADGRWCWADDPYHAARQRRTFTPERYVDKYGTPTPIKTETEENPS